MEKNVEHVLLYVTRHESLLGGLDVEYTATCSCGHESEDDTEIRVGLRHLDHVWNTSVPSRHIS